MNPTHCESISVTWADQAVFRHDRKVKKKFNFLENKESV